MWLVRFWSNQFKLCSMLACHCLTVDMMHSLQVAFLLVFISAVGWIAFDVGLGMRYAM